MSDLVKFLREVEPRGLMDSTAWLCHQAADAMEAYEARLTSEKEVAESLRTRLKVTTDALGWYAGLRIEVIVGHGNGSCSVPNRVNLYDQAREALSRISNERPARITDSKTSEGARIKGETA